MDHPLIRLFLRLPPTLQMVALLFVISVSATVLSSLIVLALGSYGLYLRSGNTRRRKKVLLQLGIEEKEGRKRTVVGFFHPYCNAGGGGERVLWTAVACLQREEPDVVCVVYTGDAVISSKEAMISKVLDRFAIPLSSSTLHFVPLKSRYLVEDTTWPRFTLLGQSLGSIFLALEGLRAGVIPDIWIDTMGYAFAYPLISIIAKVPVGSYTHYPTISTDMLHRVKSRQAGHTNQSLVAKSLLLTYAKLAYYLLFAEIYSLCLRQADVLLVNSTWTKGHVDRLLRPFGWRDDAPDAEPTIEEVREGKSTATRSSLDSRKANNLRSREKSEIPVPSKSGSSTSARRFKIATILYPPCDTLSLSSLPLEIRERVILSVAQFRPEKEHPVQLHALKRLFDLAPKYKSGKDSVKLIMAGSVRNDEDEARVESLRALARELGVSENVEFAINVPYPELIALFGRASIGLHTMIDEHFGITAVEFLAAALIPLVHSSAGPLLDIVVPYQGLSTGFHATSPESFGDQLAAILEMSESQILEMRKRGRASCERFSVEVFEEGWLRAWGEMKIAGEGMRRA